MRGSKLPFTPERVTWKMDPEDLELLRSTHSNVNDIVRQLITAYCARLREQLRSRSDGATPLPTSEPPQ